MSKPAPAPPAAAPPPPRQLASPTATIPKAVDLVITSGATSAAERILIYGTGGIGKSTLAAWLPAPLFADVEDGTKHLPVSRDSTARSWPELRGKCAAMATNPPPGIKSFVIDTATVAEEWAKEYVVANRKTEKGRAVESIEGFGWGKGWQFVYDEFNGLLADLDRIVEKGIHVCLLAHEVSSPVPNPGGGDFIRWEPHLYSGDKKGRGSIRDRLKQWADHVLFIGYDVFVEDGKAQGSATRTIYTYELPTHIASSRTKALEIPFTLAEPAKVWAELGIVTP